ncbi:MAG: anti-sigma factor domain-containing protein, partial [Thermomicrobiales bacterium]
PKAVPDAPASSPPAVERQRQFRWQFAWPALAVAATVVLVLALSGLASMRTITAQRAQLRQQASQLATAEAALAIMAGDQVQRTPLRPAANAPAGASGQVYTTADDRAIVIALANVPAPAAGQEYQTTVQIDGATLAIGVLRVDATGQGFVVAHLPGSSEVQRVWITLVPAGGAPGTPAVPLWQADIAP